MSTAPVRSEGLAVRYNQQTRQEALEQRVMALELEIQNLTTVLSQTEILVRQPRLPVNDHDGLTSTNLSESTKSISSDSPDEANSPLDDLPPEYTVGDI